MNILVITNAVLSGFLTLVMALFYFSHRTYPGFPQWTMGTCLIALAFLMMVLRGLVPTTLAIVIQNLAYPLGAVLYLAGMRSFLGLSEMSRGWYVLPPISAFFSIFSLYFFDSPSWRTLVVSLAISVPHMATAVLIFEDYFKNKSFFSLVLATEMVSASGLLLVWALWSLTISDFQVLMTNPVNAGFFILAMVLQIVITLSFLMLNVERANRELVSAQEALKFSEEKYSKAFKATPDAIVITRLVDGTLVDVNESFSTMLGYSRDEALSHSSLDLNLWVNQQDSKRIVDILRREKKVRDQEISLRSKSGKILECLFSAETILLNDEEHVLSVIRDITKRKRQEDALVEEKEFTDMVLNAQLDTFFVFDPLTGKAIRWNKTFSDVSGYSDPEIAALKAPDSYYSREDLEIAASWLDPLFRVGKGRIELSLICKDGQLIPTEYEVSTFYDSRSKRTYFVCVGRDVTERKQAQDVLRKSEEMFRLIVEKSPTAMVVSNGMSEEVEYVNPKFSELFGYTTADIPCVEAWWPLAYPDEGYRTWVKSEWTRRVEVAVRHHSATEPLETKVTCRDGSEKVVQWMLVFAGRTYIVFGTDLTYRRQSEQEREQLRAQLLQSQKMQAVGTLAAGIAHDFNNMLQVMLGYSDLLLRRTNKGEPGHRELEKIVKTAFEAKDLVQKIRLFSRKADIQPVTVNLNHQLTELTKLLSHSLLKPLELQVHLAENLGNIQADPTLMDQMVTNLAINASEAMPDGGTLTIETQNTLLDDDFCKSHVGVKSGPHVVLSISDTGRGMAKELLDRVFEPFFSTKQRDYHRGTGLGLSIVKGIVDEHDGYITVDSEVGRGTIFKIYFPTAEIQQISQAQVETKIELATTGGETILLVEDEELVRDLGVSVLESAGYRVLAVADGLEALQVYAREKETIALVILDIVMPRMDGKDCLQELLKMNPAVKVLISSGVAQEDRVKEVVDLGARGSLLKPYSIKSLQDKVREVIDSQ